MRQCAARQAGQPWTTKLREASDAMRGMNRAAAVTMCAALAAMAPNVAAQLKVAVVDTGAAIQQSEEATHFMEQLTNELKPQSDELNALRDEVTALEQKIADEGDVMSDADKRSVAKDIEDKRIDLEFGAQKLQKEIQDRRNELLQQMLPKVQSIVQDLVEVERYDFVFERSNVGYVNPRHEVTAKVTEKLNEGYAEAKEAN